MTPSSVTWVIAMIVLIVSLQFFASPSQSERLARLSTQRKGAF
jgi:hypothetical protein